MKRSCATQCQSTCDSAIQTKRLSKEEMRYYGKVIEKEKDVLLRFHDSNNFHLPNNILFDLLKNQLVDKYDEKKRKGKKKKRKFATNKEKNGSYEEDNENKAHYVSKILVDDSTKSLKISFKPCKPLYSTINEKNNEKRTREMKEPRKIYEHCENELNKSSPHNCTQPTIDDKNVFLPQCNVPIKLEPKSDEEDERMDIQPSMISIYECQYRDAMKPQQSMNNDNNNDNNNNKREGFSDGWCSQDNKMEKMQDKNHWDNELSTKYRKETSKISQVCDDSSSNEDQSLLSSSSSDEEDSNCSEEFTILESRMEDLVDEVANDKNNNTITNNNSCTLKDPLVNEKCGQKTDESLPQVVSVHFYDAQNQCQRIIDANTHISAQYPVNNPQIPSDIPKHPITPTTQPRDSNFVIASIPKQQYIKRTTVIPNCSSQTLPYPRSQPLPNTTIMTGVASGDHMRSSSLRSPSETRIKLPTTTHEKKQYLEDVPGHKTSLCSFHGRMNQEEESIKQRFIFGADEKPRKKVISSLLTPLCEREATKLADGIHEINMQYFPLRSLAQKAAKKASEETDDVMKLIEQKMELKTKIQDVDKARNLLKDIYDMVLKSKEIEDIQNFELVSHNFGVRNILNHLSLVDLYFGELGSELESKL